MNTFRETDLLLSDHMPTVTRRLFWAVGISFFLFTILRLSDIGVMIASRLAYLKASEAILQGHLWQFVAYPLAPDPGRIVDSVLATVLNLLMLFFFGRIIEEPMGSRRFFWFLLLTTLLTGFAHALFALGVGATRVPLFGLLPISLALLTAAVIWYPDAIVRFLFFIPMPMKFLGGISAALLLIGVMANVSVAGWPDGYAASVGLVAPPLIVWALLRYARLLDFCEDLWWHNPFRKGPKPVKRMSMGHPGRHSDPDDRYNDPHWKLDQ